MFQKPRRARCSRSAACLAGKFGLGYAPKQTELGCARQLLETRRRSHSLGHGNVGRVREKPHQSACKVLKREENKSWRWKPG